MSLHNSFLQHHKSKSLDETVRETWEFLLPGVQEVYRNDPISSARYVQLYTHIYQYCTCNNVMMPPLTAERRFLSGNEMLGELLYKHLSKHFDEYLSEITESGKEIYDEQLLKYYCKNWTDFTFSSNVLHHIFLYLNRHWVRREQEDKTAVYEVYSLSLVKWRDVLLATLEKAVTAAVVGLFRRHRNGDTIDPTYVTQVKESYVNMGVSHKAHLETTLEYYEARLEAPLIAETEIYYARESDDFLRKNPVNDYVRKALFRLEEERQRVERYLHATTLTKMIKTCEEELIEKHLPVLFDEFRKYLNDNRDEDIGRMYQLVARSQYGLLEMRDILEKHITKRGHDALAAVVESTEPRVYVKEILLVYKHYKKLVLKYCQNHYFFVEALDRACQTFINKNALTEKAENPNKSPELLARYCDYLLKKTSNVVESAETEDLLSEIMVLFNYVQSKDVFLKFYRQMLGKRLVENMSVSDDLEASMISKLKDACGISITQHLQKMLSDIAINQDLNKAFKEHLKQSDRQLDVDFHVDVLTHGVWPFSPKELFNLPSELEQCTERFRTFYSVHQSGRKITWLYDRSRAEIVSTCFRKRYTLTASTYQVAVLVQYNYQLEYTVQQLQENTNIKMDDLQQVIQTLLKIRILLCDSKTSGEHDHLPPNAKCQLYQDYNNKKQRVNINVPLRSAEKKEAEETHQSVENDRRYFVEAAIVRIMKTKKKFSHQELIGEVLRLLQNRFKAENRHVKLSIDDLIAREYLERDPDDASTYLYKA